MDARDALEERVRELAEEREHREHDVELAQERAKQARSEHQRWEKALKMIDGEPLSQPKPKKSTAGTWTVQPATVENVMQACRDAADMSHDGTFFMRDVNELSPHADQTNKNAVDQLRGDHRLRKVGVRDGGKGVGMVDAFALDGES